MEQSTAIECLAMALAKFQGEVKNVAKEGENPFFKSKYAKLETIIDTIKAPLASNGLSISQFPTGKNELATILMHSSGQWLKSKVEMTPKEQTPQAQGSAITYMRRYSIAAILGIATEDDDDANQASKSKKPQKVDMVKIETIIKSSTSIDTLSDIDQKVKGSKLYSAEEKKKVSAFIKSRISDLDGNQTKK